MKTYHGTVVDIAGKGVFLRGPSGCGKSDIALRLIDRGASFVADDQILLESRKRGLLATAPQSIRGYLEVRGIGIVSMPVTGGSYIHLVVDLVDLGNVPRLPDTEMIDLCGVKVPRLHLNAFEASAPLKIELAVSDVSRIGGVGPSA
ncbi:HPr kinase/phosphorylase [Kordiimonas pumila]|uniref:HPr kinase/phosphorylase n=1 Tax=Kordiimonas pumila TaxID=2161677 RepID=A0ABV7D0M8_9PROT|nr:HPr kinase/phosphatase C-terminal domain-containing protein [Kordiimonas pumila]